MKRADGVMSYEDLEFYAAELVRSGEFAGSFERVFVDEYQDVNPVQDFIIRGVSGDNVFMVGDVKQSIYGFRLSDPEIFLGRKRHYEETGEGTALEFNANFRSVNAVLDFVNCVFDEVMTEASSGVDYAKEGHFVIGKDKQDASGEKARGLCGGARLPVCGHVFRARDRRGGGVHQGQDPRAVREREEGGRHPHRLRRLHHPRPRQE